MSLSLEDGRRLPYLSNDDEEMPSKWESPEKGEPLKCHCGSTSFQVFFPRFVMTTARCVQCGHEEIVHDG